MSKYTLLLYRDGHQIEQFDMDADNMALFETVGSYCEDETYDDICETGDVLLKESEA